MRLLAQPLCPSATLFWSLHGVDFSSQVQPDAHLWLPVIQLTSDCGVP